MRVSISFIDGTKDLIFEDAEVEYHGMFLVLKWREGADFVISSYHANRVHQVDARDEGRFALDDILEETGQAEGI